MRALVQIVQKYLIPGRAPKTGCSHAQVRRKQGASAWVWRPPSLTLHLGTLSVVRLGRARAARGQGQSVGGLAARLAGCGGGPASGRARPLALHTRVPRRRRRQPFPSAHLLRGSGGPGPSGRCMKRPAASGRKVFVFLPSSGQYKAPSAALSPHSSHPSLPRPDPPQAPATMLRKHRAAVALLLVLVCADLASACYFSRGGNRLSSVNAKGVHGRGGRGQNELRTLPVHVAWRHGGGMAARTPCPCLGRPCPLPGACEGWGEGAGPLGRAQLSVPGSVLGCGFQYPAPLPPGPGPAAQPCRPAHPTTPPCAPAQMPPATAAPCSRRAWAAAR